MDIADSVLGGLRADLTKKAPIADLQWYRTTDSLGDPAIRVVLILRDDAGELKRIRPELRAIKDRIYETLLANHISEFPYIRIITNQDAVAERAA